VLAHGWEVHSEKPCSSVFKIRKEAGVISLPFSGALGVNTLNIPKDIEVKTLEEAGVAFHLISFLQ